jgi:uncharacterized protein YjlB
MYMLENIRKTVERVTGLGRPSRAIVEAAVRPRKPWTTMFRDDGRIPNNEVLPLVLYFSPVRVVGTRDPAALFEALFDANGWGDSWRNGIYDYAHYHSRSHEVLGIARGHARVRFGGHGGRAMRLKAGDVVIIPAGVGHQRLSASKEFLVVGAYPPDGIYDVCRGSPEEHAQALHTIPEVPLPTSDPVYGRRGALLDVWHV